MCFSTCEPSVEWPDPERPVVISRALTLIKDKEEPSVFMNVKLEVLVNGVLYLVLEDRDGLRRGNVLSKNRQLTKKHGGSEERPLSHCFICYDNVNDARRGIGRLDGTYRLLEIPNLREWQDRLDWIMQRSWTLHRVGDEEQQRYAWFAAQTVEEHRSVRDERKVHALQKTRATVSILDRLNRRNPGRIPLMVSSADLSLVRRTQAVRGIGRRMEWRGVVLEAYIDRLRAKCREIQRAVQQKLSSDSVFSEKRTPRTVRLCSERMSAYSEHLRTLGARPFSRAFEHAAADLGQAARYLHEAAEERSGDKIEQAKGLLHRVYRSMRMLEFHWRLEEVLVVVAAAHHRGKELSGSELVLATEELASIHSRLNAHEELTGEPFEHGFERHILPRVLPLVHQARGALMNVRHGKSNGTSYTSVAYGHLKAACAPF